MPLPVEVTPNPLFSSAVEVRFTSKIEREQLLSKIYPAFADVLPEIQNHNSFYGEPGNLNDSQSPDFTLVNDDYSLSVGPDFVTFENIGEYKLWKNYFPFMQAQLKRLFEIDLVDQIERVGLRYISILPDSEKPEDVLSWLPKLPLPKFENSATRAIHTNISVEDVSINLLIASRAKAEKKDIEKIGLVIDIDCFIRKGVANNLADLFKQIDQLHKVEKELFFGLLKDDYLNRYLNPIYP